MKKKTSSRFVPGQRGLTTPHPPSSIEGRVTARRPQLVREQFRERVRQYKCFAPNFDGRIAGMAETAPAPSSDAYARLYGTVEVTPMGVPGLQKSRSFKNLQEARNDSNHRMQTLIAPTLVSQVSPQTSATPSMTPESPGTFFPQSSFLESRETPQTATLEPATDDNVYQVWMLEHPKASKEERMAEVKRRQLERINAEKAARAKYLQRWQTELTRLERDEEINKMNEIEQLKQRQFLQDEGYDPDAQQQQLSFFPIPPPPRVSDQELSRQQLAWEIFTHGDGTKNPPAELVSSDISFDVKKQRRARFHFKEVEDQLGPTGHIVSVEPDKLVHMWVQKEWVHSTHRHESAATRIQCAFRKYKARSRVELQRRRRARILQQVMQEEEKSMLAWEVAITTQQQKALSAEKVDRTVRALNVWKAQIGARALMRRNVRKAAKWADMEVAQYAAERIQTIWRGFAARQRVKEMRNPQIVIDRQTLLRAKAAVSIQKIARSWLTRVRIAKQQKAALRMQKALRRYLASKELGSRRRKSRKAESTILRDYATRILQRFFYRVVQRRRLSLRLHESVLSVLHHACRGFTGRNEMRRLLLHKKGLAAVKIQCMYRQFKARRIAAQRRREAEQELRMESLITAGRVIFSAMRGYQCKKQVERHIKRKRACVRIQRWFRLVRATREMSRRRLERLEEEGARRSVDAAVMIQAAFRGYLFRSQLQCQQDAALIIQRAMRLALGHMRKEQQVEAVRALLASDVAHDAAAIIQRFYRVHIRRPALATHIRTAAATMIRFLRLVPALQQMQRRRLAVDIALEQEVEENSAVMIQRSARAYFARVEVHHALVVREQQYQKVREDEAAVVLVNFFRGCVAKRKIQRLREARRTEQQVLAQQDGGSSSASNEDES